MNGVFFKIKESIRNPLVVTVYMTSRCNLHCSYCYEIDKGKCPDICPEKIDQFVSGLDDNGISIDSLFLFGGEPTLCPNECLYLLDRIGSYNRYEKTRKTIFTNGISIPAELISRINSGQLDVFLSSDGFGKASAQRYGANFVETEAVFINNLRRMQSAAPHITISFALGKHNINSIVKDMMIFYTQFGIINYKVNTIRKNDFAAAYDRIMEEREIAIQWAKQEGIIMLWDSPDVFGSEYDNLYISQQTISFQAAGTLGTWDNVTW